jgi:hypothetical protein
VGRISAGVTCPYESLGQNATRTDSAHWPANESAESAVNKTGTRTGPDDKYTNCVEKTIKKIGAFRPSNSNSVLDFEFLKVHINVARFF